MANDDDVITTEDVAWLNGRLVARSARNVRTAGTVLMAVGVVGAVLVLWLHYRYQDQLESDSGTDLSSSFGPPEQQDVDWMERVDLFAQLYRLELPALAVGLGLGLHLVADYAVARTGGSVGVVAVGDPVPAGPDDEDDEEEDGDESVSENHEPYLPPDPGAYEPRT